MNEQKERISLVLLTVLLSAVFFTGIVFAGDAPGLAEPYVAMDVVVLATRQSTTVPVSLQTPFFDFHILPVILLGNGILQIEPKKTDTIGEMLWAAYKSTGYPQQDSAYEFTPASLRLINRHVGGGGLVLIVTGIITTSEGPHNYTISLNYPIQH